MAKPPPFPPREAPADGPTSADQRGLECRHCACRDLRVLYTRQRPGGIMRVRICRHCARRVITREMVG